MPYRTCIDCGSREHVRCYTSKPVRISIRKRHHDFWESLSPSEQRDWSKRRQMLDDAIRKFWGVPKKPHYY